MMRIVIPALAAIMCASPLSAQTNQFDLECDYGDQTRTYNGKGQITHSAPRHLKIDLTEARWCEGYCSEYSVSDIVGVDSERITLIDQEQYGGERRTLIFNHETGVMIENHPQSGATVVRSYDCAKTQFSGFSPSKIKAPQTSPNAISRYFSEGAGRSVFKLAPKGLFNLRLKIEIGMDGKIGSCQAKGPTAQPQLEEAVCAVFTSGEFRFRPGTDRNGDPVPKSWQHTLTLFR